MFAVPPERTPAPAFRAPLGRARPAPRSAPAGPCRAARARNFMVPSSSARLPPAAALAAAASRQGHLLRDGPTTKSLPSRASGAGRFQPCEKRLVPPSAGNRAHLSKHISTCQRELYRGQLKKALASDGSPGLPGEIKGTRGGFSSLETGKSC